MVQSWLRLRLYASPDRSAPGSSRESAHGRGPSIEKPCSGRAEYSLWPDFSPRRLSMGDSRQEGSPLTGSGHDLSPPLGVVGTMSVAPEVETPGAETASLIQLTACWDSAGALAGPFLRRVSPLHPEGLRGGYSTYHAPLGGLSIGKLSFIRFLRWRPGCLCEVVDLDALLWPRVLWSPLAFGNQGSLYLRYGGLQGLLAGIPVQDICDAGGWSTPLTFQVLRPGSASHPWLVFSLAIAVHSTH